MAIRRRAHADRVNSFILVWCGDEREQIGFDGEVFWLPPIDDAAKVGPGSPYRFESALDRSGVPISGTVRVQDRNANDADGNRIKIFDADQFVKWIEDTRPDLLDRGLFIVDLPEEVEQAKLEGRPIWEASQDVRARSILEAELFRRRRWEEKGTPAPASSSEHLVLWAIKHVNERGTALSGVPTDDIRKALGRGNVLPGRAAPTRMAPYAPQSPSAPPSAFIRPSMPGGAEVYARAKTLGVNVLKAELEGLLSDDAEAIATVQKKVAAEELKLQELTQMEEAAST